MKIIRKIKHRLLGVALDNTIQEAYNIAKETLRSSYRPTGLLAGKTHFSDIWIRDSCFASLGCLAIGDNDIVKANLKTHLDHIGQDGQIPLRVGQKNFLLKYLGLGHKGVKARYIEDKGVSTPVDGNSLLIIVTAYYLEISNDLAFIKSEYSNLKKAIHWNYTQDKDGDLLIEEGKYAGWTDSIKKKGKVLYSNVLHYAATHAYAQLCRKLGKSGEAKHFEDNANHIKERLNHHFWNGDFFIDWIDGKKRYEYFSTDGNVLAIIFGVANKTQSKKIQKSIQEFELDQGFSTHTNFPKYDARHIFSLFFPLRIHDYHNGLQWLWIGCVDAISKYKSGLKKEAIHLLKQIAEKIVEFDGVYEVYHAGAPVKRLFYKSEKHFTWSSGVFVWACHELNLVQ